MEIGSVGDFPFAAAAMVRIAWVRGDVVGFVGGGACRVLELLGFFEEGEEGFVGPGRVICKLSPPVVVRGRAAMVPNYQQTSLLKRSGTFVH